jgi:RND family efflux transporter MFP subunit
MRTRQRVLFILAVAGMVFSSVLFADESAVLQWQRTVSMSTPVSGVVVKVEAQVGARVDKGQVLLKLDDRARLARVNALQAKLKSAKNNRDESIREMERTQELYDRTLISEHELQLAKIQRDEGEAQYRDALAILSQAEMDLQYSTVRAPFSAWVTRRNVEVGQTIVSELQAEPLVILVEAGHMIARAQVSGSGLSDLNIGKEAQVIIGKKVYQGKIYHIGLSPTQGTTDQYAVDVSFEVGDKTYRAGQPAEVRF